MTNSAKPSQDMWLAQRSHALGAVPPAGEKPVDLTNPGARFLVWRLGLWVKDLTIEGRDTHHTKDRAEAKVYGGADIPFWQQRGGFLVAHSLADKPDLEYLPEVETKNPCAEINLGPAVILEEKKGYVFQVHHRFNGWVQKAKIPTVLDGTSNVEFCPTRDKAYRFASDDFEAIEWFNSQDNYTLVHPGDVSPKTVDKILEYGTKLVDNHGSRVCGAVHAGEILALNAYLEHAFGGQSKPHDATVGALATAFHLGWDARRETYASAYGAPSIDTALVDNELSNAQAIIDGFRGTRTVMYNGDAKDLTSLRVYSVVASDHPSQSARDGKFTNALQAAYFLGYDRRKADHVAPPPPEPLSRPQHDFANTGMILAEEAQQSILVPNPDGLNTLDNLFWYLLRESNKPGEIEHQSIKYALRAAFQAGSRSGAKDAQDSILPAQAVGGIIVHPDKLERCTRAGKLINRLHTEVKIVPKAEQDLVDLQALLMYSKGGKEVQHRTIVNAINTAYRLGCKVTNEDIVAAVAGTKIGKVESSERQRKMVARGNDYATELLKGGLDDTNAQDNHTLDCLYWAMEDQGCPSMRYKMLRAAYAFGQEIRRRKCDGYQQELLTQIHSLEEQVREDQTKLHQRAGRLVDLTTQVLVEQNKVSNQARYIKELEEKRNNLATQVGELKNGIIILGQPHSDFAPGDHEPFAAWTEFIARIKEKQRKQGQVSNLARAYQLLPRPGMMLRNIRTGEITSIITNVHPIEGGGHCCHFGHGRVVQYFANETCPWNII